MFSKWSEWWDSNPQPSAWKADALANWATLANLYLKAWVLYKKYGFCQNFFLLFYSFKSILPLCIKEPLTRRKIFFGTSLILILFLLVVTSIYIGVSVIFCSKIWYCRRAKRYPRKKDTKSKKLKEIFFKRRGFIYVLGKYEKEASQRSLVRLNLEQE